jgi:Flp pilus assembly protein TadG
MDTVYDNIAVIGGTSVAPQSISGSSAVDGSSVDTTGYASAEIYAYGAEASGSPSAATLAVKLQESSDNSTWSDALDNTGTVIGFTLNVHTAAAENAARIEGLNLNRKTYLRAVITPSFTSGSSPASVAFAQILLGAASQKPVDDAVSNT